MTQVALSPPNRISNPDIIYETTSSVATADCEWAATCGQFFRPDSMRKQWSKSRLRFSSARRSNAPPKIEAVDAEPDVFIVTPKPAASAPENVLTENEHWTVVESGNTSPIMIKNNNLRPKGTQPPRLVLDAAKGSPDRTSTLVIKSVPPTAPPMPSTSENTRCPPSRSLSSPFPMQFRARTAPPSQQRPASPPQQTPASPSKRSMPSPQRSTTSSPQRISSMIAGGVSPRRDLAILDAEVSSPHAQPLGSNTKTLTITGLCKPVPMKRTKSVPVRKGKRDLPPPCPSGGRRFLRLTPRVAKFKKQTARNTSIMDNSEEESEEDEEETLVVVGTADTA